MLKKNSSQVLSHLIFFLGYERDSQYQLIVVTTTNIRDYNDLKGKKYCHPGNNFNIDLVNNYLLNDFERNVIRTNNLNGNLCEDNNNNNSTYFENYIKTIATYFGKSCRPVESTNSTINEKLCECRKSKFTHDYHLTFIINI